MEEDWEGAMLVGCAILVMALLIGGGLLLLGYTLIDLLLPEG